MDFAEVRAYKKVWIIGDEFVAKSYGPYFQQCYGKDENDRPGYIKTHYDTTGFCSGSLSVQMHHRNVIGRVHNNLIDAINSQVLLPKVIVVVIEDDLLNAVDHFKIGASDALGPCIEWMFKEFHRTIAAYKEKLPTKARKFKYPQILWVAPVFHDGFGNGNYYREKHARLIQKLAEDYREMHVLYLPMWNTQDMHLVAGKKMTANGLSKYWEAVNDSFQSWDKAQMRQAMNFKGKGIPSHTAPNSNNRNDRFHWIKPSWTLMMMTEQGLPVHTYDLSFLISHTSNFNVLVYILFLCIFYVTMLLHYLILCSLLILQSMPSYIHAFYVHNAI